MRQLETINWLTGTLPSRKQLKEYQIDKENKCNLNAQRILIRVDRSLPFEYISNVINPFFELSNLEVRFEYSDYDTALAQLGGNLNADAFLLWIDWRSFYQQLSAEGAVTWLISRILSLRENTKGHIFVNNWTESLEIGESLFGYLTEVRMWIRELNYLLGKEILGMPGSSIIDLNWYAQEIGNNFFDMRNEELSHYPFSDSGTIFIAKHLGIHVIPAAFRTRLKAIVVDLDDTLYSGILGEDGINGLKILENHKRFHKLLRRLKDSGILLAILSRNEKEDVERLFDKRKDFLLKRTDFSLIYANWSSKALNLKLIAENLNIDVSSILFVDDNPAEILKVKEEFPTVKVLLADPSGKETYQRLINYPGLYLNRADKSADLRTADIQANQKRNELRQSSQDLYSYLCKLNMAVTIFENNQSHTRRIFELSQKTNQFNLALQRLNEVHVDEMIRDKRFLIWSVGLKDDLTDSGIIGALICFLEGKQVTIKEMIFSCRSLGREVETLTFCHLLRRLMDLGMITLSFEVCEGPRNAPARNWLGKIADGSISVIEIAHLLNHVEKMCKEHPAKVEKIIV